MGTDTRVSTGLATLEIAWAESPAQESMGVQPDHIANELINIGELLGLATAEASDYQSGADPVERAASFGVTVRMVHFGSPLIAELSVFRDVTKDAGALALLIYGLKRAWGIDLELRAHRADMRRRFIEAEHLADVAERMVEEGTRRLEKVDAQPRIRIRRWRRRWAGARARPPLRWRS
jgi:hypothetical protein